MIGPCEFMSAPDRSAFEREARYQGATNFTLASGMTCGNGWALATYQDPATELAWRVWANKGFLARAVSENPQSVEARKCVKRMVADGSTLLPSSCPTCGIGACSLEAAQPTQQGERNA